ncbi:uncharacterized protein LOC108666559 [Hyalella azteca]|uniref:Uncharacterized protein LOC108666559 n=1 Tax=Hyalella azteca TaxID=294128 RepID=A0A8B7N513_HYAAZ|nr:uncharacterized protein LOC108666559 [Hyalella azteca]
MTVRITNRSSMQHPIIYFSVIITLLNSCELSATAPKIVNDIVSQFHKDFNASRCAFSLQCLDRASDMKYMPRLPTLRDFLGTTQNHNISEDDSSSPAFEQRRLPCRCDQDCSLYGDCCVDGHQSSQVTPANEDRRSKTVFPATVSMENLSCRSLFPDDAYFPMKMIYMVDKCPSMDTSRIARHCEKDVSASEYRYLSDVPVVSARTRVVYANWFCAQCHGEMEVNKYNRSLLCNCNLESKRELRSMTYLPGELAWTSNRTASDKCLPGAKSKACVLAISYPVGVGRSCEKQVVDSCKDGWPVAADREFCASYRYFVQDALFTKVYKNPTCAKCNGVAKEAIQCLQPSVYSRFGDTRGLDVFLLSDLFSINEPCKSEDVYDFIFEECLEEKSTNMALAYSANIIFLVLLSISLIALVLHMVIFFILWKQRNLHTKNLFSMACSLFWAELLLVICPAACHDKIGCYVSTIIVYLCFLSAFFWMNVMSFDVCKTFRTTQIRSNSHRLYIKYATYAFGAPVVLASIAILVNEIAPESAMAPGFGVNGFWFSNQGGLRLFFCGPALLIFVANIVMLSVSIYDIFNHHKASRFAAMKKDKKDKLKKTGTDANVDENTMLNQSKSMNDASTLNQIQVKIKDGLDKIKIEKDRLILYLKLALIMGAPWIFAFFQEVSLFCKYAFNILNSLQGLFIFIAFDCKPKLIKEVCEKLGWHAISDSLFTTSSATNETSLSDKKETSALMKSGRIDPNTPEKSSEY